MALTKITGSVIAANTISADNIASNVSLGGSDTSPRIATITYPGDDTAAVPAGGQTIVLTGANFANGAAVYIDSVAVGSVTVTNSTSISFTAPAKATGSYVVYVINSDGGTAIHVPGIQYSGTPTWSTAAGSLGTVYETGAISSPLSATGDGTITYSLQSGTLPSGATLSSNGLISGTANAESGSTTYNFTIRATDSENQDTDRSFSLTISADVVTWVNPANGASLTAFTDTPISNIALSATSAAGANVTYTANSLPTGLTLANGVISGTPTVEANTSTLLTATATTTRTATNTITWTISVAGDIYFKNAVLLLPGSANTFVKDNSNNNFSATIVGDTKPSNFNPYSTGWSNYFDGTGDYLTVPYSTTAFDWWTSDYTIEAWVYPTSFTGWSYLDGANIKPTLIGNKAVSTTEHYWGFGLNTSGNVYFAYYNGSSQGAGTSSTATLNAWNHIAFVKSGTSLVLYLNGVGTSIGSFSGNSTSGTGQPLTIGVGNSAYINGYVSNLRIVKGTAVYTSTFTPPTSQLTAISGTSLLTCADNRFIDESSNALTITKNGDVAIRSFSPFTEAVSTNGSGYFDGDGDYLTVPGNAAFNLSSGNWTIECWFYTTASKLTTIVSQGGSTWRIQQNGTTIVYNASTDRISGSIAANLNAWNHVALVSNSGTITLYINGASAGTTTSYPASSNTDTVYVGINPEAASWAYPGYISNLRIVKGTAVYTSAFTPPTTPLTAVSGTSLLTLQTNVPINNNLMLDSSGLNNVITRNGNTTQGSFSPYSPHSWSNYFDGSGDYIQVGSSNTGVTFGTADFTIEAWIYWNSLGSESAIMFGNGVGWTLYVYPANKLQWGTVTPQTGANLLTGNTTLSVGTWYHIAVTRASGTVKLWVNGVSDGTVSDSANYSASGDLRVGISHSNQYFNGYMSNVRVVKGTAVYTSNFTPPAAPLTAISGTSILTCADNRFIDESPNAYAITRNGDTRITNFAPFASHVQPPTSYSTYFDGTGDYLTATGNTAFNPGTQDFTIECWVYRQTTDATNRKAIGTTRPVSGTLAGWVIFVETTGYVGLGGWNSAGTLVLNYVATANPIVNSVWTHVAVVKVGNNFTIYMNGVASGTGTASATLADGPNFYLGTEPQVTSRDWNGYISNFRIVKGTAVYTADFTPSTTPLTAISNTSLLICQDSTLIDNSSNKYTITATANARPTMVNPFGSSYTSTSGYTAAQHGGSMYFDGTGDYLSGSTLPPKTGVLTVEAWVYVTDRSAARCVFTSRSGNTTDGFQIVVDSGGEVRVGYSGLNFINSTANSVVVNQWYHLAVTRNSAGLMTLWINGISAGTSTRTNDFSSTTFRVGLTAENGNPMFGYISGVRAVNRNLYTSSFYPPVAPVLPVRDTTLLLDGTSGAIVDATSRNVLETVGDAKITNALSKFGRSSIYLDGNDYLSIPDSPNIRLGSSNFTMEGWFWFDGDQVSFSLFQKATSYQLKSDANRWVFQTPTVNVFVTSFSLAHSQWLHIALVRNGSTTTLYVNGTAVTNGSSADAPDSTSPLQIGSGEGTFKGYMQDVRITRGIARYTTNFTPPTTAFYVK